MVIYKPHQDPNQSSTCACPKPGKCVKRVRKSIPHKTFQIDQRGKEDDGRTDKLMAWFSKHLGTRRRDVTPQKNLSTLLMFYLLHPAVALVESGPGST